MRRILPFTLLALTLMGSVAMADRDRGRSRDNSSYRGQDRRAVRPAERRVDRRVDRRHDRRVDRRHDRRVDRRVDRRYHYQQPRHQVSRRPVYVNNGRYVFSGGISRTYTRPVIRQRYFNYSYRPQIIIENYDPVPGYIWVQGSWSWNGREWLWIPGHYAPDPAYQYGYSDGYYSY